MPKKIKLIDLTKIKKSHYLFMRENSKTITEAEQYLENYKQFTNEIGYTPEVKQKLQDEFILAGKKNQIDEAISEEKNNLENTIKEDIKQHKKILNLKNNLLKPKY
jgi:hypothetical protein